jgi:hypothetical protein
MSGDGGDARNAGIPEPYDVAFDFSGSTVRRPLSENKRAAASSSAASAVGSYLYVTDPGSHVVRRISLASNVIERAAGTGTPGFSDGNGVATAAMLNAPRHAALLDGAPTLYISDYGTIRSVLLGHLTTFAGSGAGDLLNGDGGSPAAARLNNPTGVALDAAGGVYIADRDGYRIRKVATGVISTAAGTGQFGFNGDGDAKAAMLGQPEGVHVDGGSNCT